MIDVGGPVSLVGNATPEKVVLGCLGKETEPAGKLCSSMVSASFLPLVPQSEFLP